MTKAELIEKLQKQLKDNHKVEMSKKAVGELVDEVFNTIAVAVKREKRFSYPGFGTWTVKKRNARLGRNLKTGEPVKIPATKALTFRAAPNLRNLLSPRRGAS